MNAENSVAEGSDHFYIAIAIPTFVCFRSVFIRGS